MSEPITLLINRSDIEPYAQIALNAREENMLFPHILAAQNVDIKPVLGASLFTDLLYNRTTAKYVTLLDGGTYTDADGNFITFQGLKAALSCFTFARYTLAKNAIDTPFGMVAKKSEYSEQTDPKIIMSVASEKRNEGGVYLQECLKYIEENPATYPLFEGCGKVKPYKFIHKITGASQI